jgi:hypothetical protein
VSGKNGNAQLLKFTVVGNELTSIANSFKKITVTLHKLHNKVAMLEGKVPYWEWVTQKT